jgi:hypothetical protein
VGKRHISAAAALPYEHLISHLILSYTLQQRAICCLTQSALYLRSRHLHGSSSNTVDCCSNYSLTPPYTPYRYRLPAARGEEMATRRSHNKTRLGCHQCKRRRIKVSGHLTSSHSMALHASNACSIVYLHRAAW